ncbi:hypothetical protein AOLI_G00041480 [Acnodon oligacanthus]
MRRCLWRVVALKVGNVWDSAVGFMCPLFNPLAALLAFKRHTITEAAGLHGTLDSDMMFPHFMGEGLGGDDEGIWTKALLSLSGGSVGTRRDGRSRARTGTTTHCPQNTSVSA